MRIAFSPPPLSLLGSARLGRGFSSLWRFWQLASLAILLLIASAAHAAEKHAPHTPAETRSGTKKTAAPKPHLAKPSLANSGQAPSIRQVSRSEPPEQGLSSARIEQQLQAIYLAIGQADNRSALALAEDLTRKQPNFQLGHMLYADLLLAQTRPVALPGSAPEALTRAAPGAITDLRAEAKVRIKAQQERPPAAALPENFTALSHWNEQAIAVDISKSRLYLFTRNAAGELSLAHDYYISIARLGAIKNNEGDLRTPLGPYFITSHLYPTQLPDFYGAGALPLNYPNPYDVRRGKSGSGIWLHGTPKNQYSRPPQASEGCVVLTNPDFRTVAQSVSLRSTPVLIAKSLRWVQKPGAWEASFDATWQAWRQQKLGHQPADMAHFYYASFAGQGGQTWLSFYRQLQREMQQKITIAPDIRRVSRIYWREAADEEVVVTTFGQTLGELGKNRRQYWRRKGQNPWRIFYESDV
jgi:murein L,D-transpeptidase YafK